jgi:hypothetical protein
MDLTTGLFFVRSKTIKIVRAGCQSFRNLLGAQDLS